VVGTRFQVKRSDIVEVSVTRGIVQVSTSNQDRRLLAGDAWQGSADPTVSLAQILAKRKTIASAEPAPEPAPKLADDKRRPDWRRHRSKAPSAQTPVEPPPEVPKTSEDYDREELAATHPAVPRLTGGLARLRTVIAKNPRKAAEELQRIAASENGEKASFALYSRAHIQLLSLDDPRGAVKTAKQYERRFPRGKEAQDVLWLRVIALCEGDDRSACRAAAHTYLRRYPRGRFADLSRRITNW
jgi:hypothetical protein